jgi:hypothetical protein
MDRNLVGWFEIPVENMNRAKMFYDTVFEINITVHDLDGLQMGWFPTNPEKSGATGSLVKNKAYIPSATHGPVLYFSCEDVVNELNRIEGAGGEILQPKTQIGGGHGFMAFVKDTEGNRIALHSNN